MKRALGVTLIELVIVIALLAILSALAFPSFSSMIRDNQRVSQINHVISALHFARSESIKRGIPISVCSSDDAKSCRITDKKQWGKYWLAFADNNANRVFENESESIIRVFERDIRGFSLNTQHNNVLAFFPSGQVFAGETITFCDDEQLLQPKAVVVNILGRVSSSLKTVDNSPLECSYE